MGTERESDRLLGQLRRTLRAELMHEFMLDREPARQAPLLGSCVLGFDPPAFHRNYDAPDTWSLSYRTNVQQVMRPYRLCIDPPGDWLVCDARVGTLPLAGNAAPVSATAFAPLPSWMSDFDIDMAGLRRMDDAAFQARLSALREAMAKVPITNIALVTAHPGVQVSVRLTLAPSSVHAEEFRQRGAELVLHQLDPRMPRVWCLAHVLE